MGWPVVHKAFFKHILRAYLVGLHRSLKSKKSQKNNNSFKYFIKLNFLLYRILLLSKKYTIYHYHIYPILISKYSFKNEIFFIIFIFIFKFTLFQYNLNTTSQPKKMYLLKQLISKVDYQNTFSFNKPTKSLVF